MLEKEEKEIQPEFIIKKVNYNVILSKYNKNVPTFFKKNIYNPILNIHNINHSV